MRKPALFIVAILALTTGLWASVRPVRVPCPEMAMAMGGKTTDPCPLKDCCRLSAPTPLPAGIVAAPAQVKPAVIFLPPILLALQAALPPAGRGQSPADERIRPPDPPPPPRLIPLRI
jgi:hypothetical protein